MSRVKSIASPARLASLALRPFLSHAPSPLATTRHALHFSAMASPSPQKYARDQPAGVPNRIERIAVVGVGGHIGRHIVDKLQANKSHTITALMRAASTSHVPAGVISKTIDYADHAGLVAALAGQQALIITMWSQAPPEQQTALIRAAAEAGVQWIMPNHYGVDLADKQFNADTIVGARQAAVLELIESLGVNWVSLACGFWYQWSVCWGQRAFGISWPKRKVLLWDDGRQKITTSTWDTAAQAIARVFALPVLPQDADDTGLALSQWRNKLVYVESFAISQRDILDSIQRVTGTTDEDFTIEHTTAEAYYAQGLEDLKKGDRSGFIRAMYSRHFYPDGKGRFSHKVVNEKLGLPRENLDDATREAIRWLDSGEAAWSPDLQT